MDDVVIASAVRTPIGSFNGTLASVAAPKLGGLVVAEIAVTIVLLVGAGLFIRSAWRLQQVSLGFETSHAVTARVALPPERYESTEAVADAYRRMLEQIRATPGVEKAGASTAIPLTGGAPTASIMMQGKTLTPGSAPSPALRLITDDYIEAIGMRLLSGRTLTAADLTAGGAPRVLINEQLATLAWPGENPIGKRLSFFGDEPLWHEMLDACSLESIRSRFRGLVKHTHEMAARMAASSVCQRSSWKLDQDTPITLPSANALADMVKDSAAPASMAVANLFMIILPAPPGAPCSGKAPTFGKLFFSSLEKINDSPFETCQHSFSGRMSAETAGMQGGEPIVTTGIRHDDLRRQNRAMVLSAVRRAGGTSRAVGGSGRTPTIPAPLRNAMRPQRLEQFATSRLRAVAVEPGGPRPVGAGQPNEPLISGRACHRRSQRLGEFAGGNLELLVNAALALPGDSLPALGDLGLQGLELAVDLDHAEIESLERLAGRADLLLGRFGVAGMVGLSFAAVPLYRMFCQVTGYGGTPQQASVAPEEISDRVVTVRFTADVAGGLGWKFQPMQKDLQLNVGENKLAFYVAENLESKPVTGRATFNVSPDTFGPYFSKIDCFCFKEQTLQRLLHPVRIEGFCQGRNLLLEQSAARQIIIETLN